MAQEDKELLLKDLCSRLPYGVKVQNVQTEKINTLLSVEYNGNYCTVGNESVSIRDWFDDYMPYLRPMSSMTEEEEREVRILWNEDFVGDNNWYHCYPKTTDFYLSHHLDFRNLIQKGLALEAPEGMYKTD